MGENIIGFAFIPLMPKQRPTPISFLLPPARITRPVFNFALHTQTHSPFDKIKLTQITLVLDIIGLSPDYNLQTFEFGILAHFVKHFINRRIRNIILIKNLPEHKTLHSQIHRFSGDIQNVTLIFLFFQGRLASVLSPSILTARTTHFIKIELPTAQIIIIFRLGIDRFGDKHSIDDILLFNSVHVFFDFFEIRRLQPSLDRPMQIVAIGTINKLNQAVRPVSFSVQ